MFGEKWTPEEIAKVREIKSRDPSMRKKNSLRGVNPEDLEAVDGMTDQEVAVYIKENGPN
jgi:hypothetical protein